MKNRFLIKLCCSIAAVLAVATASAESTITAAKVVGLLPRSDGFYFNIERVVSDSGCSNNTLAIRVDAVTTELAYKTLVQSISLAFALDKSVNIYLDGCVNASAPRVRGVDVY